MPMEPKKLKENLREAVAIEQTPDIIMAEITAQTLQSLNWIKKSFDTRCKSFWVMAIILATTTATFALSPKIAIALTLNVIKWRSSAFFLYSSFELVQSIRKKIYSEPDTLRNPWPCLNLITSILNWIGFSTAITALTLAIVTPLLILVPMLNFVMSCAFALGDISNAFFEYKADTDLIESVNKTEGANKETALNYLHTRRSINLVFNTLKAANYIGIAAFSLLILTNPLAPFIIGALAVSYLGIFCIQKSMLMLKARNYRQNTLSSPTLPLEPINSENKSAEASSYPGTIFSTIKEDIEGELLIPEQLGYEMPSPVYAS